MTRRVAITGLGVVSCLGQDLATVSASLRAGRSGIGVDPEREARGFRSPLTGVLAPFDVRKYVTRQQARSMAEPAAYAAGAACEAVAQAGLSPDALRSEQAGVIVGNDSAVLPAVESWEVVRTQGATRGIGSGAILQTMNSTVSINLATLFGVRGAAWTVAGACASGAHAIGQAMMLIQSGMQDLVVCGGAQEINAPAMAAFDAIGAFAKHDGERPPHDAVRPFDAARTGLVPSGGAAMLVLEAWERAEARGATILGELAGYGFSCDGEHVTQPAGTGAVRAMRQALRHAGVEPGSIDYINAHATGTEVGDAVEGKAILEVFGARTPPVSSTKSMTGHECWMAGASEAVYCLLMMRDGFIAPNRNLTRLDPSLEGLQVVPESRPAQLRTVLSNSFGFGGTNAALVLRAAQGAP